MFSCVSQYDYVERIFFADFLMFFCDNNFSQEIVKAPEQALQKEYNSIQKKGKLIDQTN